MSDGPSILTGSRTYMTYVFLMWAGLYFDVTESWVADAFELFDEDGDGTLSQVFAKPSQPAMHLPPADTSKTIHRRTAVCMLVCACRRSFAGSTVQYLLKMI